MSKARQCIAKAIECEQRGTEADDPGVRKAYRRVAAEWLDITEGAVHPPARTEMETDADLVPKRRKSANSIRTA